jgi:nitrogen fixation-related uncharacterized protein
MFLFLQTLGDKIVHHGFMLIVTISLFVFLLFGFFVLSYFNMYFSFLGKFILGYLLIPLVISALLFLLFFEKWHYLLFNLKNTEKGIKYTSSLIAIIIITVSFFYTNKNIQFDDKRYIEMYKEYNESVVNNNEKTILNSEQFKSYKRKISIHVNLIKFAMLTLIITYIFYFYYILLRIEISNIEYPENKFFIEWYLSEQYGWIIGTISTKEKYKEVLQPNDCLKVLKSELDYSKTYNNERREYYRFIKRVASESETVYTVDDEIYTILGSCNIVFVHYEIKRIKRAERKYGELPYKLKYAIEERLVKFE